MFNGFIYKITSNLTERVYIGSTTKSLERRLQFHKAHYNQYLKGNRRSCTSFELIKLGDYKINILQTVEVNSKKELHDLEALAIHEEPNAVNICIPNRTKAQYRQDNKEEIKIYQAQYRQDNKDELNEKFNCQYCDGKYTKINKSGHYKSNKHIKGVNELKKAIKANPAFLNL